MSATAAMATGHCDLRKLVADPKSPLASKNQLDADYIWEVVYFDSPIPILSEALGRGCQKEIPDKIINNSFDTFMTDLESIDSDSTALYAIASADISEDLMRYANDLYIAGRPEALNALFEKLYSFSKDGDAKATAALAILGGKKRQINNWDATPIRRTLIEHFNEAVFNSARYYPRTDAYLDTNKFSEHTLPFSDKLRLVDNYIRQLQDQLTSNALPRYKIAVNSGYVPMLWEHIFGGLRAKPCFSVSDKDISDIKYKLDRLDYTGDIFADLEEWANSRLHELEKKLKTSERSDAKLSMSWTLLAAANVASDCYYSHDYTEATFGGLDFEVAERLLNLALAMGAHHLFTTGDLSVATALMVERHARSTESHYAAGRLMLIALQRQLDFWEFQKENSANFGRRSELEDKNADRTSYFISRFSTETIREAQMILQGYDLYKSSIDGMPGKGLRSAVTKLAKSCEVSEVQYPDLCVYDLESTIQSDWLKPFINLPKIVD